MTDWEKEFESMMGGHESDGLNALRTHMAFDWVGRVQECVNANSSDLTIFIETIKVLGNESKTRKSGFLTFGTDFTYFDVKGSYALLDETVASGRFSILRMEVKTETGNLGKIKMAEMIAVTVIQKAEEEWANS